MSTLYTKYRGSQLRKSLVGARRRLRDAIAKPLLFQSGAGSYDVVYRGPATPAMDYRTAFVNDPAREIHFHGQQAPTEIRLYRGDLRLDPRTGLIYRAGRPIADSSDGLGLDKSPGLLRMLQARKIEVDRCVSFLHLNSSNYFHALAMVLPRLPLLAEAGLDTTMPIVVEKALFRQRFFQGFIDAGYFKNTPIVTVEANETVVAKEVFVVRPEIQTRRSYDMVLDRLGQKPAGGASAGRRIFIRRGRNAPNKRFIGNETELVALLTRFGFETIDPQELSFREQMETFAAATAVVSQHGAGLTNILFRRGAPLHVVELFQPAVLNGVYHLICGYYGFRYSPFLNLNSDGTWSGTSDADLPALQKHLDKTLRG